MERLRYVFIIHVLCAFVVIWCCLGIMWCAFCVIWCAFVILWCAFGVISDVLLSLRGVILSLLIKRLLEVSTKISLTGKHEQNLKVAIECVNWQRISSHSILYSAWWRRTFCLRHMSSAFSRKVIQWGFLFVPRIKQNESSKHYLKELSRFYRKHYLCLQTTIGWLLYVYMKHIK